VPRAATPPLAPADVSDALEHGYFDTPRGRDDVLDADDGAAVAAGGFEIDKAKLFPPGPVARLPVRLPMGPSMLGLLLRVSTDTPTGTRGTVDLILRDAAGKPAGGLAIDVTVV
jgi:hypothetical protein